MDYNIISVAADGNISFVSGDTPERVFGMSALIQELLIELLSDFDSRTGRGCDLIRNINNVAIQAPQEFAPIVSEALRTAQTHILANQSSSRNKPPEERLSSLGLIKANMSSGVFSIDIRLVNAAGQEAAVTVPL